MATGTSPPNGKSTKGGSNGARSPHKSACTFHKSGWGEVAPCPTPKDATIHHGSPRIQNELGLTYVSPLLVGGGLVEGLTLKWSPKRGMSRHACPDEEVSYYLGVQDMNICVLTDETHVVHHWISGVSSGVAGQHCCTCRENQCKTNVSMKWCGEISIGCTYQSGIILCVSDKHGGKSCREGSNGHMLGGEDCPLDHKLEDHHYVSGCCLLSAFVVDAVHKAFSW